MKTKMFFTGLILFASCYFTFAQSAKDTKTKLRDKIAGVWKLESVVDPKTNKDAGTDSTSVQEYKFNLESQYVSKNGKNVTIDSGTYRLSESHALLYLESKGRFATGSNNPATSNQETWLISGQGHDVMNMGMRGQGTNNGRQFRHVFRRATPESGMTKK